MKDICMKILLEDTIMNKKNESIFLTAKEVSFYNALNYLQEIKDFYKNNELVAMTKELVEAFEKIQMSFHRLNIPRASIRMVVRKVLIKYKYPHGYFEDAVKTVIAQYELWFDNLTVFV